MLSIPAALAFLVTALMPEKKVEVVAPPEPYTLPHLIGWLAKQSAHEPYDWECGRTCLVARYAGAVHAGDYWSEGKAKFTDALGLQKWEYGIREIATGQPRTFGGALNRARALEATW